MTGKNRKAVYYDLGKLDTSKSVDKTQNIHFGGPSRTRNST